MYPEKHIARQSLWKASYAMDINTAGDDGSPDVGHARSSVVGFEQRLVVLRGEHDYWEGSGQAPAVSTSVAIEIILVVRNIICELLRLFGHMY